MVGESKLLYNLLNWHMSCYQSLNLLGTLLLHIAQWCLMILFLKGVLEETQTHITNACQILNFMHRKYIGVTQCTKIHLTIVKMMKHIDLLLTRTIKFENNKQLLHLNAIEHFARDIVRLNMYSQRLCPIAYQFIKFKYRKYVMLTTNRTYYSILFHCITNTRIVNSKIGNKHCYLLTCNYCVILKIVVKKNIMLS